MLLAVVGHSIYVAPNLGRSNQSKLNSISTARSRWIHTPTLGSGWIVAHGGHRHWSITSQLELNHEMSHDHGPMIIDSLCYLSYSFSDMTLFNFPLDLESFHTVRGLLQIIRLKPSLGNIFQGLFVLVLSHVRSPLH